MYVDTTFIYKGVWEAPTRETSVCMAEPGNSRNKNAMAFEKNKKVIAGSIS